MSNIEWTDQTWNPVVGCTPVSPGCLNCYAATIDHVVPRSMGGRGGSNLVVACETCNSTKGSLPHSEFVNRFAELAKARADAKLQRRISRNRRRLAWSIALWLHKQEALYFEEQLEKLRAFRAERAEIHH